MTVVDWLLDSDPAIRWQVMRDLTDADEASVAAERAKIADDGWGARLLALQDADGQWAGGTYFPPVTREPENQPWTATAFTLQLLRQFGIDPADERVRTAVELVRENSRWEYDGSRFFDGEVEPCINGMTVAIGAYFGEDVSGVVERLLTESLDDGGWNCEAEFGSVRSSFNSTISVLEGLLAVRDQRGRTAGDHGGTRAGARIPARPPPDASPARPVRSSTTTGSSSRSRSAGTTTSCVASTTCERPG